MNREARRERGASWWPRAVAGVTWRHVGWVAMAMLVAAGALGLLGSGGPLGLGTVTAGALELTYPRFVRRTAPLTLHLQIAPTGSQPVLTVTVRKEWLQAVEIDTVTPSPVRARLTGDGVSYEFLADFRNGPVEVWLHGKAKRAGVVSGAIETGGDRVVFTQLSYP